MNTIPWTPKALEDLPFLLVGPILRKITRHSVNVFIVTKESCISRLKIYKHNGNENPSDLLATGANNELLKIGANLYVGVVSISLSFGLEPGITYGYQVEFIINNVTYNLWTISDYDDLPIGTFYPLKLALNTISFQINGNSTTMPTFVIPPYDSNKLRVLHGSCRKPHGEGRDAMEHAWTILHYTATSPDSVTDPALRRPQMMFLTGDQIYSDDVSDIMLFMIDKYAQLLLDWDENLASLGCNMTQMNPGQRADNVGDIAKFSVDKEVAGSHLIRFREFVIMYCMVWSNSLWVDDGNDFFTPILPSFEDLYPNGEGDQDRYEKHSSYLTDFFKTIQRNLRATLANIPTYMIFDDHEITDDLFYNGKWFDDVINRSDLGKRICTNGMAAYALFQDWGNKPEDYLSGTPGKNLLDYIYNVCNNSSDSISIWNEISNLVLPELDMALSMNPKKLKHRTGSLNWHYYYEVSNAYEFIILDTRTMRVFNNGFDSFPGLISDEGLENQIANQGSNKSKSLIFVISPTPVIDVNRAQRNKEFGMNKFFLGKLMLDLENWGSDSAANEHFFSKLFTRNPNSTFLKVILLGGDVHYAYSNRMQYWEGSGGVKRMAIAALCASSFKNEVSASNVSWTNDIPDLEAYSKGLHPYILDKPSDKTIIYGWGNLNKNSFSVLIDGFYIESGLTSPTIHLPRLLHFKDQSPAIFDRNKVINSGSEEVYTHITNNPSSDWHYRVVPMQRINSGYIPSININGFSSNAYKEYVKGHQNLYKYAGRGGEYIVGYNNMGDVVMESGNQGPVGFVYHRIWWSNDADRNFVEPIAANPAQGNPYTIHKIDMGLYPKPDMNIP